MYPFLLVVFLEVRLLDHIVVVCSTSADMAKVFSKVDVHIYIPSSNSSPSTSSSAFGIFRLLNFSHSVGYSVGFICISLM